LEIISGYVEVHVFRFNQQKIEYLLLKRGENEIYPGLWQIVTGKIKPGEKAYETAVREIKEETGLKPLRLWAAPKVNQFYSAEKDAVFIVPVFAAELKFGESVTICREHCDFKWIDPAEARELLPWDEQQRALDIVTGYLLKLPHYLDLVEISFRE
jgi:dihydroneopterin triphosphate diphosphatase